jgi:predicted ATPase/DNA-binding CsgD family transcriptional regulator/transcriptional regulator with XRE-family HTH domain
MAEERPALEFAVLLRQLRSGTRLTQEELAEASGLSPRSISDLERGINRTARKDTAVLLADALGLAEPARALFIGAARGRAPAAGVLAALQRQAQAASVAAAGEMHGFPAVLTSFIGRAAATRRIVGLLGDYRLVTVTGPGGSGKTRLAGEVARRMAGQFADGAWLVELALVADSAQVPLAVATALGVREEPGVPAAEAVARALARQQLLLVLDNCEHVIGAAAALCTGLLAACDDVRVLATSREPLRAGGEARYRLAPLSLPGPDDAADPDGSEAVALFADRARQADAHFTLDGRTGSAVASIVIGLDGMPLAIELAAARVEALGVAQLRDRLDDRFALLTTGDRAAAGRQRSLAAMVEWSYQLLDDDERRVFRAVSVFPGPFTLEAAAVVAGPGAGSQVLHLVDCSLLVPPRAGPDGRSRYVMLETLRAYGAGLLAAVGEQDAAAAALARYALQVAEQAGPAVRTTTGELAAARWLDAEDATMRQVLARAMRHDRSAALRLALALCPWWFLRGRWLAEYQLLREAAEHAEPESETWSAAQYWLGTLAMWTGDLTGALEHFTAIADAAGDGAPSPTVADCLASRSAALFNLGRVAEAAADGRRALALSREFGYPAGEALALAILSITDYCADEMDSAVQLARQAGQITADIPGVRARSCIYALTIALIGCGDLAAADRSCAAGLARSRETGDVWNLAGFLPSAVLLDLRAGRTGDARAHLRELLQTAARTGARADVVNGLDSGGHLCAQTGRCAEAVTLWAAHAAIARHEGYADTPADARMREEALSGAREALGPARARAARDRGTAMSLATAGEYALMLTASGAQDPWAPRSLDELSARERDLVTLVAQGCTDAQIAGQLDVSIAAVRSDLNRIRDKTGGGRRADLTRLAIGAELV